MNPTASKLVKKCLSIWNGTSVEETILRYFNALFERFAVTLLADPLNVFLELTVTKIFKVFRELDQNGQKSFLRFVLRILISSKSVSLLSNNGLIRVEWNHQNVSPLSSWWLNFSLLTRIQVKLLFCIIFQFWKIIWRSQKENGRALDNFCRSSIKWRRPRSGVPNQSMLTNHYQGRNMGEQSATNISRMHSR